MTTPVLKRQVTYRGANLMSITKLICGTCGEGNYFAEARWDGKHFVHTCTTGEECPGITTGDLDLDGDEVLTVLDLVLAVESFDHNPHNDAYPAPGIAVRDRGDEVDVFSGGWRVGSYRSALGVRNAVERHREDRAEVEEQDCPGSGQPVEAGSRCRACGTSFGFPHPAGLVVGKPAPIHEGVKA